MPTFKIHTEFHHLLQIYTSIYLEHGGDENIITVLKNIRTVTKMDVELFLFSSKFSPKLPKLIPIWSMNVHILNKTIITTDYVSEHTTLSSTFYIFYISYA